MLLLWIGSMLLALGGYCSAATVELSIKEEMILDSWPAPPPWQQKATVARYVVHYADWTVVSAISPEYKMPFGTLQSFADGLISNSTGIPYFYIAKVSDTYKNIAYNNCVSMTVTQNEGAYCKKMGWDPEEPVCSRVTLTGRIVLITNPTEVKYARKILFTRHPAMAHWPAAHDWRFYKMELTHVHLLDYYGGATHVPLPDYFKAKP